MRRRYLDTSHFHSPLDSPQLDLSGSGDPPPPGRGYYDVSSFRSPYDQAKYFQDNSLFGLGAGQENPMQFHRGGRKFRRPVVRRIPIRSKTEIGPLSRMVVPRAVIRPGSKVESMAVRRQLVKRPAHMAMRGFGAEEAAAEEVVEMASGSRDLLVIGLGVGMLAGAAALWLLLGGGKKEVTPNRRRARRNGKRRGSLNDAEREMWVLNDEGLYRRQRSSRQGMREFIRKHRAEIDEVIRSVLDKPPRRNGRRQPQPESGYAYMGDESVHDKNFRRVSDDAWEIVMITPSKAGPWHYLGTRYIDGSRCNVWRVIEPMTGGPVWYAQTAHGE